jgi:eukaryotic-like serine/threonine-protein kinase
MTVVPERIVAGRYLLERPIGRGGMGVVWLAHDRLLDREVAIKEITLPDTLPEHERDSLRASVLRETRAAARLVNPGVITVYDVLSEQGRTFIVMELITAPTLAEIVARWGPLPPERVARIGLQVAFALDAAHQAGIVHRDVKPANVMVAEDGGVWLADFGIAHLQGDPKLTTSGLIVGSPAYMAPEQASGGDSGPEVDLWGLGATMYYAVEGEAPFERASSLATLAAVVNEPPRPPWHAGALAPIIMSLLAKDPAARPALRKVRVRLAQVAATGGGLAAGRAAVPVVPSDLFTPTPTGEFPAEGATHDTAKPSEAPTSPASRAGRDGWMARRRWLTALAVLVGVAVLAGVAAVVLALALTRPSGSNNASGKRVAVPTHVSTPTTGYRAPSAPQGTPSPGGASTTTSPPRNPPEAQPVGGAAPRVPAGWASFSNPSGGYAVAYPSGWRRSTGLARHGTSFSEGTGRYLKVESAHPPQVPPSGDPLPGWISNEQYWSARLPGYHLIGSVHGGTYHGMRAAIWEYTYVLNGRLTHGLDISFVSPSRSWGYSVLHLIPQDRWRSSQELMYSFEQAFSPLS